MRRPSALIVVISLSVGLASSQPALASVSTKQVSVTRRAGDPKRPSFDPSVSDDGRYVAFTSLAQDLVHGDGNLAFDVFVRDLVAGTTTRVSVDSGGGDPNGSNTGSSISGDGRYVAFSSSASDLVPRDGNGDTDVFIRDLVAGVTTRVSVDTGGGNPNGASWDPSVSPDGRYVAFRSYAPDLVAGDGNGTWDVFVRDRVSGTTARASVDIGGGDPNGASLYPPSISADGRYVAFSSDASDLVDADGNNVADMFVRDLVEETTVRASVDIGGGDPNDDTGSTPSISADGRYVAFRSFASDLVAVDGNMTWDVFVRDLVAGTTTRASVDIGGGDPNSFSYDGSISADGRYMAFYSNASDLVPEDGNGALDVFVRDLVDGITTRVSVDTGGGDPNADSYDASVSSTGRYVAFSSEARDLVIGPQDHRTDVFIARLA